MSKNAVGLDQFGFGTETDLLERRHDQILRWLYKNAGTLIHGTTPFPSPETVSVIEKTFEINLPENIERLTEVLRRHKESQPKKIVYTWYQKERGVCRPRTDTEFTILERHLAFLKTVVSGGKENFLRRLTMSPIYHFSPVTEIRMQSPLSDPWKTNSNRPLGYMDMTATFLKTKLSVKGLDHPLLYDPTANLNDFKSEEFYLDTVTIGSPSRLERVSRLDGYFDVRATVKNIGVVLREIDFLHSIIKAYYHDDEWRYYVVAPMSEEEAVMFKSHGYHTIVCPDRAASSSLSNTVERKKAIDEL